MYRNLAIASAAITLVIFAGYCALGLLDEESQFVKDYGYTIGLLTLPFCCGVAPLTGLLTLVFGVLALNERKHRPIEPPPGASS